MLFQSKGIQFALKQNEIEFALDKSFFFINR